MKNLKNLKPTLTMVRKSPVTIPMRKVDPMMRILKMTLRMMTLTKKKKEMIKQRQNVKGNEPLKELKNAKVTMKLIGPLII